MSATTELTILVSKSQVDTYARRWALLRAMETQRHPKLIKHCLSIVCVNSPRRAAANFCPARLSFLISHQRPLYEGSVPLKRSLQVRGATYLGTVYPVRVSPAWPARLLAKNS
jgi:hypothetical protein